jgi:amino acid transporter
VGKSEVWIVGMKVTILFMFIAFGIVHVNFHHLAPSTWAKPISLFAGGMIIFLAYEGFELIANTAQDVREPQQTLPKAYYSSVGFVIVLYVLVSMVTAGNLSIGQIVAAKDYALAEAAKPFLGHTGYTLIAIAALLSTGSAINATLYGAARISYIIAKDGELPTVLEHKVWNRPVEGLLITSVLTLLASNFLDLSSISLMGSAGFLIIFAFVNAANVRLHRETNSKIWISAIGAIACITAFGALVWRISESMPSKLWLLGVMLTAAFSIEASYRVITGRQTIQSNFIKKGNQNNDKNTSY